MGRGDPDSEHSPRLVWRFRSAQAQQRLELERENPRLRKAVSDLTLEKVILKEAASGKW